MTKAMRLQNRRDLQLLFFFLFFLGPLVHYLTLLTLSINQKPLFLPQSFFSIVAHQRNTKNRDNPFFSGIDATPDIRLASRKKSIPLVSELVVKTMTMAMATKRNAGLASVVPRASLNDEELVSNK